jgi:methylated-DNA-[protein]-cysteine S-methyltransferase
MTMGQSPEFAGADGRGNTVFRVAKTVPCFSLFATELGWFGLVGEGETTDALSIGHPTADEVRDAIYRTDRYRAGSLPFDECDWFPRLRQRLQAYCQGARDDFNDCRVRFPRFTDFQRRVWSLTRRIGYGEVLSYGELAEKAGSPGAARAVGRAMAANPVPIIVPCHRVVGAHGTLGGYSAPGGLDVKQTLLAMEGALQTREWSS